MRARQVSALPAAESASLLPRIDLVFARLVSGERTSQEWVRKNVLRQSDEEIEEIDAQIEQEPDPVPEEEAGGGNNFR